MCLEDPKVRVDRGPPDKKAETRGLAGRTQTPGGTGGGRLDEEGSVTSQALPSGNSHHICLEGGWKGSRPSLGQEWRRAMCLPQPWGLQAEICGYQSLSSLGLRPAFSFSQPGFSSHTRNLLALKPRFSGRCCLSFPVVTSPLPVPTGQWLPRCGSRCRGSAVALPTPAGAAAAPWG